MKIERLPIDSLRPWDKNPKTHTPQQIAHIAKSIQEFGMNDHIGIWGQENIIVEGHGRLEALKLLGHTEVDCIRLDHLSDEERRAYALAHNQLTLETPWDTEALEAALADISLDMAAFGFSEDVEEFAEVYTRKIDSPVYEITGENPAIESLFDKSKTDGLISQINAADIPNDVKAFLKLAAYRHTVFNYRNIAEYYAHAPKEVQELMENSALVIIDYDKAVEDGFVTLHGAIEEMINEE